MLIFAGKSASRNPDRKECAGEKPAKERSMRKMWMIFALVFCLLAGITGSVAYAYLIDRQETINRIHVVENKTHIEEEFEPPQDPGPGEVIKKKPCIVNDSMIPVYVRVKVEFSNREAREQCQPLEINSSWKAKEDGYYYYQEQLEPGERTETVFDNIVIKNTIKKEDLVPFDILVYEESVQSEGFSSPEEAFSGL